ncbi:hypothetical protein GCM10008090_28280 [Arenicella chitinivorans]|uniref:Peptidoglycan-binding protein CsiV n=1 Tax=Arenicella chitinivorans TaxID=1329800 RepID=A0A918S1T9_9GAMM|nr:CsiV family protein [Arenicella chitinivorans]GHA16945.1 hypothetical protein GCM10008090_28280 [Arenicella chitinivorans]
MNAIQRIYTQKTWLAATITGLLLLLPATTWSKDYKVEVLIFENNNPASATERHDYVAPEAMRSNSATWQIEPDMLVSDATAIDKASEYSLKHHLAWGQEALPYRSSATYTVLENDTKGYIKVYADDLLFVNLDLDYKGFRMEEKRRLKLNEKHFFDHPKFGVLLRVSRLEARDSDTQE